MTSRATTARRASYGPNSPVIGERGSRTRQAIVESTLARFADHGFHATLVDDIARDAQVSRATLYQYFESKEAIFAELVEESGAALMRVVKRLGPLGPSKAGFASLHQWLTEWASVFDKYATIFVQWANVNSPETDLQRRLSSFLESHTAQLGRVVSASSTDVDADASAVLMLSVLERGHYIRHLYWPADRPSTMFTADLAIAFQLYLFPRTQGRSISAVIGDRSAAAAPTARTAPSLPSGELSAMVERLTPQGRRTVTKLLDAGAAALGSVGFTGASVELVVTHAGVARGTFYKYFADRLDLLHALNEEAAAALRTLTDAFGVLESSDLEVWLERFLDFHRRYSGVLRVWTERLPADARLAQTSRDTAERTAGALVEQLRLRGGDPVVGPATAAVALMAVLEHFPDRAAGTRYELTDQAVVEAQHRFISDALLHTRNTGSSAAAGA